MSDAPMTSSDELRYTSAAIVLHWLSALLLIALLIVGFYMSDMAFSPAKIQLITWHKWGGIIFLILSALRLLWRWTHRPPPLPTTLLTTMKPWELWLHQGTLFLMYVSLFAMPLVGWGMSNAAGYPIVLFNLIPLPNLVGTNMQLAGILREWHESIAYVLMVLIALHILGVLKHWIVDKYLLTRRMWWK